MLCTMRHAFLICGLMIMLVASGLNFLFPLIAACQRYICKKRSQTIQSHFLNMLLRSDPVPSLLVQESSVLEDRAARAAALSAEASGVNTR